MATVAAVSADIVIAGAPNLPARKVTWSPLIAANPDGAAVDTATMFDRSVQVVGISNGATLVIQGRNNGTDWATLHDPSGNALSFTGLVSATEIRQILEVCEQTRPFTSGGGAFQILGVVMLSRMVRD
jgi:hypothetical protein